MPITQCSVCKTFPLCQKADSCLAQKPQPRDAYLDGIMSRRGATPNEMEAEARVRTSTDHLNSHHEDYIKAILKGHKIDAVKAYRLWKNVGLKEAHEAVVKNWDNQVLLYMDHAVSAATTKAAPSSHQSGLWLALYRCTNYLPASLYDALKQEIEKITDSPSPYASQDWIARSGIRIFVHDVNPPIPIRNFDWCAHYDDAEGPKGEGSTPYMAILDLINNANPSDHFGIKDKEPKK